MSDFSSEYKRYIQSHLKRRKGRRWERLQSGLGQAEQSFLRNVWWPAFQHFDGLHPEYEVQDFREGYRYIDFAYIQPHYRIAIEIDGLGPHWRNISKWQFSDHCLRQNHLVIDGWYVLRFSADDVADAPRICQQTLQQFIGRMTGQATAAMRSLSFTDREIIRLAMTSPQPITPLQVSAHLHVSSHSAVRYLRRLTNESWLQPASGTVRVRSYRLHPRRRNLKL